MWGQHVKSVAIRGRGVGEGEGVGGKKNINVHSAAALVFGCRPLPPKLPHPRSDRSPVGAPSSPGTSKALFRVFPLTGSGGSPLGVHHATARRGGGESNTCVEITQSIWRPGSGRNKYWKYATAVATKGAKRQHGLKLRTGCGGQGRSEQRLVDTTQRLWPPRGREQKRHVLKLRNGFGE